jgi:hypothetical protein
MISSMIISTVFLMLIGLTVLFRAYSHAPEGYEDEYGFHQGSNPQGKRIRIASASAVMARKAQKDISVRVKRMSARTRRQMADQGSTAPFSN